MIKTKASLLKVQDAQKSFKAIKIEKPQRLPKTKPPHQKFQEASDEEFESIFGDGGGSRKPKKKKNEVTFDSARREILNFGLSGKSKDEKSNQTEELLLKLGAKPLKKKGRNYKEILEEKKKLKQEGESVNKRVLFGTSASLQFRSQQKKKSKDDGLLKRYGRVEKGDRKYIKKAMDKNKRK